MNNINIQAFAQARALLLDGQPIPDNFALPRISGPFNWARDWFDGITPGDRAALIVAEEDGSEIRLTFDELKSQSNQFARLLIDHGIVKGDRVMVALDNTPTLWVAMLALMKIGTIPVPTTTALSGAELRDRIDRAGVSLVITMAEQREKFAEFAIPTITSDVQLPEDDSAVPDPGTVAEDPLLFYFTSGTTSLPKLVEHSQTSYPVGHLTTMYWLGLRPGDIHLNISSPGWAKHIWSSFFAPWNAGATVLVLNYRRFAADVLQQRLNDYEVTTLCAPPTVWRMLVASGLNDRPSALREAVAAGEPLNPELISQVRRAWSLPLRDGYGQTEMTAAIGTAPGEEIRPGSVGRPLPGVPIVLADVATSELVEDEGEGEICIQLVQGRGPVNLMTGYRVDGVSQLPDAELYRTGDIARRDQDGVVTFVGRDDDVFKASDYKISPFEIENVLMEHPAVQEVAVVPAPDLLRLSVPKAYVALAPDRSPSQEVARDILEYARAHLAPYKRIRRIEFVEMPKTISGKIRRVELRAWEEGERPDEWTEADLDSAGSDR